MTASGRPAWHPDPSGRFEYRFHNGAGWTADVSTDGQRYVDPLGVGGGRAAGAGAGARTGAPGRRDGIATAAMVLGIIGLSTSWIPLLFVPGAVCALLGVVFGLVAWRRGNPANRPFAITGTATGGAGVLLVGIGVWTTTLLFDAVDRFENPPLSDVDLTRCASGEGGLTVAGTITNLGGRTSDYRITVRVPGRTVSATREVAIVVLDVAPGRTAAFDERYPDVSTPTTENDPCRVVDVTGPLPLGLDLD